MAYVYYERNLDLWLKTIRVFFNQENLTAVSSTYPNAVGSVVAGVGSAIQTFFRALSDTFAVENRF